MLETKGIDLIPDLVLEASDNECGAGGSAHNLTGRAEHWISKAYMYVCVHLCINVYLHIHTSMHACMPMAMPSPNGPFSR